ncbi:molybdopterin-synthase adenylyltransferase MoeB [Gammaproteobacteria bacterium]|nr:molybdopterin-synthase adenylyltransferase MoeB [Gammaproteobacteria bacterium]
MNDQQLLRYSRQIMLPQLDISGQEKLLAARVLIIGLGGLGCPAAMYLASAGVGQLTLVDDDKVELSNLQRQIAHVTASVGMSKVASAGAMLKQLNPEVKVIELEQRLSGEALNAEVANADVILDCTDNFETRFAVNKAAIKYKRPLISAAAIRMEGQITVFDNRQVDSPCYQCLYDENSELNLSCSESGVMAPLVGIIGAMQAMETIKLLTDLGRSLTGKLLLLDATSMQWQAMQLSKDKNCTACNQN